MAFLGKILPIELLSVVTVAIFLLNGYIVVLWLLLWLHCEVASLKFIGGVFRF